MHVQIKRIKTHVCMVENGISPGRTVNNDYPASEEKLEILFAETNTICSNIMFLYYPNISYIPVHVPYRPHTTFPNLVHAILHGISNTTSYSSKR